MDINRNEQAGTVAELGEFALIAALRELLPQSADVVIGPGDDAAIVRIPDEGVVATTDVLVEGTHFRRDWSSAQDVGIKGAAANLSDVVAMGARPNALLVGLAIPADLPVAWVLGVAEGLQSECDRLNASVVGGDIVRSERIMLSITALGHLDGQAPVRRSGARAGDVVAVAGRLGHSAAGLAILSRGFRSPKVLADAHRRPHPDYEAALAARAAGATSMCDVSDGLVADLGHLCDASGVAIDIDTDALHLSDEILSVSAAVNVDPMVWVLGGGEDHAFIATFGSGSVLPKGWRTIGRVGAGSAVTVDGAPWLGEAGHRHF